MLPQKYLLDGFALAICLSIFPALGADSPLVPDPAKTPGDVLTTDTSVICKKGYTKTVRDVPEALKNQVYRGDGKDSFVNE